MYFKYYNKRWNSLREVMKTYKSFSGIAWPTIGLFLTVSVIHLLTLDTYNLLYFSVGRCALLILHVLCAYAQFTVMHDASHNAISTLPKWKWLNPFFGWMAQLWMGPISNFYAFRYLHRQHHAYTNDPEKDPDHWIVQGPKIFMFLRWLMLDVGYWSFYIPKAWPLGWPQRWQTNKRPTKEIVIVWTYYLCIIALLLLSIYYGFFGLLFWNWILPSRLSKILLAYLFDYLPHYPHKITQQQDKYHTTRYLYFSPILQPFATLCTLYQNFHIFHHLHPNQPFFCYRQGFLSMEKFLIEEKKITAKKIL